MSVLFDPTAHETQDVARIEVGVSNVHLPMTLKMQISTGHLAALQG
jgi:hypothetical protein|tara:strand:- start:3680 stop:3817 length:138 start_codon:yes stop_codon:yes gene_type:complete